MSDVARALVYIPLLVAYFGGSAQLWIWGYKFWMVVGFFFPPIPVTAFAVYLMEKLG